MTLYTDDRPHPIKGMVNNPEWEITTTKRAELYLAERAHRLNPEPTGTGLPGIILSIVGVIAVAASWIAGLL